MRRTCPDRNLFSTLLVAFLQGHGLIEAVLQQQERQPAAPPTGSRRGRTVRIKGGLRGWDSSSSSDDSDDEAAGGLAGTFVGGGLRGSAGSAGAAPSPAAAPSAAAAAQLAALHAAAASIHAASFAEMLSRVVPVRRLPAPHACAPALLAMSLICSACAAL